MVFCSDLLCEKNVLVSKKPNFSELSVMNYNHSMNNSWIFLLFWQKYVPNSKNFNFSGSLRPKPGFGIGPRNQGPISVSEPIFFPETLKKNFYQASNCSHFPPLFGEIQVLISLKINPDLQKWFKSIQCLEENLILGALLWWKKNTWCYR